MKRALPIILSLCIVLAVMAIAPFSASAAETDVASTSEKFGDFYYEVLEDNTISITGVDIGVKTASIPAKIDGKDVTKIAFDYDETQELETISIPISVTEIKSLGYTATLKEIKVHALNSEYSASNGVLFNKDKSRILMYPQNKKDLESYTIPYSVYTIPSNAFYHTSLKNIIIPDSVSTIQSRAFVYSAVETLTIPDSVYNLPSEMICGCYNLTTINLPSSIIYIDPEFVTYFVDGSGDWNVYRYNDKLTAINMDSSNASYCSVDGILFNKAKTAIVKYPEAKTGTYSIPSSVKYIMEYAFQSAQLTGVTIPTSVSEIREFAFADSSLASVTIPKTVKEICTSAFENSELKSVTISNGVTTIGHSAFYATSISSLFLPNSVTSIGMSAFEKCGSIKAINIPNSLTTIGDCAFNQCASLKSVLIPSTVKTIGTDAFGGNTWTYHGDGEYTQSIVEGFTIYGYKGTEAQKYAARTSFEGVMPKFVAYTVQPPVVSKLQNAYGGVQITVTKPSGAAKLRVFRRTASTGWAKVADITSTSYIDKTAKDGVTYAYTARAISSDGKSYTSAYDTVGKGIVYYAAPVIKSFQNVNSGTQFAWSATAGAAKYRAFALTKNGWTKLGDTTGTSFINTYAKSGLTYTYTVRAIGANGSFISGYNTTGWKYTFIAAPNAPTLKNSKNGVVASWTKPSGATNFRVFRKTGTGSWTKIADTTSLTYTDKTAKNGVTYTYTIRCISPDGKKFYSGYNTTGTTIKCKR